MSIPASSSNDVRHRLEELADVRANADFERDLAALGKAQRAVRLDPGVCPEAIARLIADNGGKVSAAAIRSRR